MKKNEIKALIDSLCDEYAELNPVPKNTTEWLEVEKKIGEQLPLEVETNKTKMTVVDTKTFPIDGGRGEVTVEVKMLKPVIAVFDPWTRSNRKMIEKALLNAFIAKNKVYCWNKKKKKKNNG